MPAVDPACSKTSAARGPHRRAGRMSGAAAAVLVAMIAGSAVVANAGYSDASRPVVDAAHDDIGARLAAPQRIVDLVDAGDFKGAEAAIATALHDASLGADPRMAPVFQSELLLRILNHF